ncbi:MAG: ATP-binding protein [Gammaproteobacteria bacterium]|nr:ATP-binding protein [Gammaproteobacteria bacterium]NNF60426.1 ATP-binding protein [Gammaproteobacteria bacterium]NNM20646.1 ATP-binding protein [Gammaproteobacteria bacterium]
MSRQVTKVALLGAPSTGKTSLARALAQHYDTAWMPEYGREYWMEHQESRRLSPEQLVEIAEGHLQREKELLAKAKRYLFVDTEAIVTYHYALDYHGAALPRLIDLANAAADRYDFFFLCGTDIPYEDTWERSGRQHRERFQAQIRDDLLRRGVEFVELKGPLADRLETVRAILEGFK